MDNTTDGGTRITQCNSEDPAHNPEKPITPEESEIIDEAYQRFRYGVRMLEILIRGDYNATISHNRIHSYLMGRG